MFVLITNKMPPGSKVKREFVQENTIAKYLVLLLGTFLRCVRYGPISSSVYSIMVSSYKGGDVLLHVPSRSIKSWYALGICRLLRSRAVDSLLSLLSTTWMTMINCGPWKIKSGSLLIMTKVRSCLYRRSRRTFAVVQVAPKCEKVGARN